MASPENDLTSLVPISVVSKTRKNSRHGAPEERIARGPILVGSSSPEAVRRIPQTMEGSVEEERLQRSNGKGKQPMVDLDVEFVAEVKVENRSEGVRRTSVVSVTMHDDTSDDEGQDLCVICLQAVRDPTIVGECGHQIFCFECINVWANQSRKCPLCTRPMAPFLLHELDSPFGPTKFYLPPLPTIRPNPVTQPLLPTHSRRRIPPRPAGELGYSARDGLVGRNADVWARVKRDSRGVAEEDLLERAVERRREVYRFGLYAKHIASNSFTRFKPCPTPCQFAENKETIARVTSFIRRELRVWRHLDVEFLTTYIVSLMKSIDIRSEPAVRLLADFLDERGSTGRDRRGAEQFSHEVYSFLRSPYRDLALYDAIAQYDPVPVQSSDSESEDEERSALRQSSVGARIGQVQDDRADSPRRRSRSFVSEASSTSSSSIRSISPPPAERSRKRARLSPKRWNRHDSYIVAPRRQSDARQWNTRDVWVNDEVKSGGKRHVEEKPIPALKAEAVLIPERPAAVHRGMRGWDETEEQLDDAPMDNDAPMDVDQEVRRTSPANDTNGTETAVETKRTKVEPKPSLELRIFGVAGRAIQAEAAAVPSTGISYDSDWEDRALDSAIWTGGEIVEAPKSAEQNGVTHTAVSEEKEIGNDLARATNRERLLARLEREKQQHQTKEEPLPESNAGSKITAQDAFPHITHAATEPETAEAEAKAKARLQLKLRLERERALAAEAKKEDVVKDAPVPTDRAATLRAKLVEKKLAAARVQ